MDTTELDVKKVPEMFATRFPEEMKPELAVLMALEKRKLSDLCVLLIKEYMPVKKMVHDMRNTLSDISDSDGNSIQILRRSLTESSYKDSPGLDVFIFNSSNDGGANFTLSKESALVLAANLSIFLNEVNL